MRVRFGPLKNEWTYPLIIAIAGFCYYISYFNYGINLGDEGYIVQGGARVLRGRVYVRAISRHILQEAILC